MAFTPQPLEQVQLNATESITWHREFIAQAVLSRLLTCGGELIYHMYFVFVLFN